VNEPNHLHDRLDAQDSHVHAAYLTAASAHSLARKTDRDISDLQTPIRASTGLLNALRDTQLDQGRQLAKHGEQLAKQGEQLTRHGEQLTELRNGLAIVDARFERADARLERMESRLDRFDSRFDEIAELIRRSGRTA
jgi:chromosome segregation ATPase